MGWFSCPKKEGAAECATMVMQITIYKLQYKPRRQKEVPLSGDSGTVVQRATNILYTHVFARIYTRNFPQHQHQPIF